MTVIGGQQRDVNLQSNIGCHFVDFSLAYLNPVAGGPFHRNMIWGWGCVKDEVIVCLGMSPGLLSLAEERLPILTVAIMLTHCNCSQ